MLCYLYAHVLCKVIDYLAGSSGVTAQESFLRVVLVGDMMVDAELYPAAVDVLIVAHKVLVGDINSYDGLWLEVLPCSLACEEAVTCREAVVADHSAPYAHLGKYILQTEACSDTVAVGVAVSDYHRVLAVSEEQLSLTETDEHTPPSLQKLMELPAYLRTSLDGVVGDKAQFGSLAHFQPVEKFPLYEACGAFQPLNRLL